MMARIEVIVEEPSAEKALRHILPRILGKKTEFKIINMHDKGRLQRKLPGRLKGYATRIRREKDLRILVLVDRDADDCNELKQRIERAALDAGLPTKTRPAEDGSYLVVNRIVVVELESWFIGDTEALRKAFPKLSDKFPKSFNNPDNGGTCKRLHRFLKEVGIYKKHYPKIKAADKMRPASGPAKKPFTQLSTFQASGGVPVVNLTCSFPKQGFSSPARLFPAELSRTAEL